MKDDTNHQPVFIVGVPRSGTTLLAAMLSAHSRFSCGPETHFFDCLTNEVESKISDPETWPYPAVDYLYSILNAVPSIPDNHGFSRDEITAHLQLKDKTVSSIASALPGLLQSKLNKDRWIDKTPDHILQVRNIRKHFPDAAIIRIVRDPRDVALSLERVPWGPKIYLEALIKWYRFHTISEDFFNSDINSYSIRFEELVTSPENELRKLCEFLREAFEASMLDTSRSAAYVNRTNEPWKMKITEKVDASRAFAWKEVLSLEQRRQADSIVGKYISERDILAKKLRYWNMLDLYPEKWGLYLISKLIGNFNVRFWHDNVEETTGCLQSIRPAIVGSVQFARNIRNRAKGWASKSTPHSC